MSLEKLAQLGWYKAEPTSPKETADLFSIVDRSQPDLKVEGISDDLRFQAAYNGILTLATIARATGFRVSLGQGHHQRVIESLEQPHHAGCRRAREMGAQNQISCAEEKHDELRLGRRRFAHRSCADHQDLTVLREQVKAWLKQTHPELLKGNSMQS